MISVYLLLDLNAKLAKVNVTKRQIVLSMKTINFDNFNSAFTLMQVFNTEKKCIRYLESKLWKNSEPVSPYDPTSKVYRRGDGMYRCKNTVKNFNIRLKALKSLCVSGSMPSIW